MNNKCTKSLEDKQNLEIPQFILDTLSKFQKHYWDNNPYVSSNNEKQERITPVKPAHQEAIPFENRSDSTDKIIEESKPQESSISEDDLLQEAKELNNKLNHEDQNCGMLTTKTANAWIEDAKKRPIPKMLFGCYWYEGELCILFADTNVGKSILAVQIGDSISKGVAISGFPMEAKKQKVFYLDFELSDKQFENRYSAEYDNHYDFSNYLLRSEMNPDAEISDSFKSFEEYVYSSLEKSIIRYKVRVVIVDNLTYLGNENEKAKDALPLMKLLKALKTKYGLSILVLAHTPKRDLSRPITQNDLQGSKMLINFCDSAFTIGSSQADKSLRYLKQIKARFSEIIYDTSNVCLCEIKKPYNFLQFAFINFSTEREHLKELNPNSKQERNKEIMELKAEGKKNTEIAKIYGVSEAAIRKVIKQGQEDEK